MKKTIASALAILTLATAWAVRPALVGHRGSSFGLENSVESFTNGAKLGYDYLETDFRVTKDTLFICSHDTDVRRLTGNPADSVITIADYTLSELQAIPLHQTRLGREYTGRLCSGQEYLDICKENGVKPLIELKWSTGINNNDCSNIPLLVKFLEENGVRDSCIILTSMKKCLEYIRTNYPDIKCQFLTGQYWPNHFDWCVQWGLDADVQTGDWFDKAAVDKYHDAGLKVNCWTVNGDERYLKHAGMGCDYITTDNLDAHNLPAVESAD